MDPRSNQPVTDRQSISNRSPVSSLLDHDDNLYYLHNNDHAGLQLVTYRLSSGAEFHSMRRSVCMALNVCNKLGFIDSSIRKPPSTDRNS